MYEDEMRNNDTAENTTEQTTEKQVDSEEPLQNAWCWHWYLEAFPAQHSWA